MSGLTASFLPLSSSLILYLPCAAIHFKTCQLQKCAVIYKVIWRLAPCASTQTTPRVHDGTVPTLPFLSAEPLRACHAVTAHVHSARPTRNETNARAITRSSCETISYVQNDARADIKSSSGVGRRCHCTGVRPLCHIMCVGGVLMGRAFLKGV